MTQQIIQIHWIDALINSNASFWNDQDWHGGEVNAEQEYGLRIDCVFTDNFRKKLGIDKLSEY